MPRRASKVHSVSLTMTKKNHPRQWETLKPPTIPRNVMGKRDAWDSVFITRWLKNRKRGAPMEIAPRTTTNKKKKAKNNTSYLSVAAMVSPVTASAAVASDPTAVNNTSTNGEATSPPSKSKRSRKHSGDASKNTCVHYSKPAPKPSTRKSKYNNREVGPIKSALDRVAKAKLKGYDPKLSAGDIIITGGTIQDRIKSVKAEADKLGVSSLLCLKNFCCTEKTKMMTSKLDCDYIQELITL